MSVEKIPKVLLMGNAGVGKSSMISIIFSCCSVREAMLIGYTHEIAESRIILQDKQIFDLYDCGGQIQYKKAYLDNKRERVFSKTDLLIFVLDVSSKNLENDYEYFESCTSSLKQFSTEPRVVVLLNKIDLLATYKHDVVIPRIQGEINSRSSGMEVKFHKTSILTTSLYRAWTGIILDFTSQDKDLRSLAKNLADQNNSYQVIVFDKNTVLPIYIYSKSEIEEEKLEEVSCMVKKFKNTASKSYKRKLNSFILKCKGCCICFEDFTDSSYIMNVFKDEDLNLSLVKLNTNIIKEKLKAVHS